VSFSFNHTTAPRATTTATAAAPLFTDPITKTISCPIYGEPDESQDDKHDDNDEENDDIPLESHVCDVLEDCSSCSEVMYESWSQVLCEGFARCFVQRVRILCFRREWSAEGLRLFRRDLVSVWWTNLERSISTAV